MKKDSIIQEVRKHRDDHASKFNYDLDAIVRDFKTREGKDNVSVVSLSPKRSMARRS